MIVTEFYDGQGLGNQLWVYVTLRSLAAKNGFSFGVKSPEKFKGIDIFDIDFGETVVGGCSPEGGPPISLPEKINVYIKESQIYENNTSLNVTPADPRLLNISDHTKFDGTCQSLEYIIEPKQNVSKWLSLRSSITSGCEVDFDVCVVHVRGGDYLNTYSFLPRQYYENAMSSMKKKYPGIRFVAVTDDLEYCKGILPNIKIIGSSPSSRRDSFRAAHHLGGSILDDFLILNGARYVILSASTFSFWAAYLNPNKPFVMAPKYWFSFSKSDGWWSTPGCIVPDWVYLDRSGLICDGIKCLIDKKTSNCSPVMRSNKIRSGLFRIQRKISKILSPYWIP